jgi:hypothetical protein
MKTAISARKTVAKPVFSAAPAVGAFHNYAPREVLTLARRRSPWQSAAGTNERQNGRATRASAVAMAHALEQLLDQPFPVPTPFYVLDRIARRRAAGKSASSAEMLCALSASSSDEFAQGVREALDLAEVSGLVTRTGPGESAGFALTAVGNSFLRGAKDARLALWKVNPSSTIKQICAIEDHQDRKDISRGTHNLTFSGPAVAPAAIAFSIHIPETKSLESGDSLCPIWAGLLTAPAPSLSQMAA